MRSDFHGSAGDSEHVVLVRLVTRGLSEGIITLDDIRGLTGREIRTLLAERAASQPSHSAHTWRQPELDGQSPAPTALSTAEPTAEHRIPREHGDQPSA